MKYDYNIINHKKGILVLFKNKDIETDDMTSELELIIESAPDAFTEDWTAIGLECSNPAIPEINELLFDVTRELGEHEPISVKDLINLCEKIADHNNQIYCYKKGILDNATR